LQNIKTATKTHFLSIIFKYVSSQRIECCLTAKNYKKLFHSIQNFKCVFTTSSQGRAACVSPEHTGTVEAYPGAMEAHLGAMELTVELWRLTLEPQRLTLEQWRLTLEP
jgi:hypothetical protein